MNCLLGAFGTGAFHCGIEVFRHEYSFAGIVGETGNPFISGVFICKPQHCEGHTYSQSIEIG